MLGKPQNDGTREVTSLAELRLLANDFLRELAFRLAQEGATFVTLSGELGSGKTAFTKEVAHLLGITETVTSPTFILEKFYPIPDGSLIGTKFTTLVHIDAYRLESAEELRALDLKTLLENPTNLIFLEWPERVAEGLPKNAIELSFEYVNEAVRRVSGV